MSQNSTSIPPPPPNSATSSICGLDVGSENCYIAIARAGGIEILLNDYSQRSTPAFIAFGDKQRELGVSAKQKQMMNLSNTCYAPNRLVGRQFIEVKEEPLPFQLHQAINGEAAVKVWHNGEENDFTVTQVMAMLFTKLRQVAGNCVDCVVNCPNFFTDSQRRSLMDAAVIAGLNPIQLINDMTAIGLYYGFYRTTPSESDITIAAFIDSGNQSTQTAVILFNNKENKMEVLSTAYEANIGGRHFDEVLGNYFIQQQNLTLNKRSKLRLFAECERVKKQMSANNNDLPVNIECLQDDKDFSARIDRTQFESLAEPMLERIEALFERAFEGAKGKHAELVKGGLQGEFKIDVVEVVGGTSRIPALKRMAKKVFGVDATTTLNADEAVARGCALQCAMLSPTFRVARDMKVVDISPYTVNCKYWHSLPSGEISKIMSLDKLFPKGHNFPFTRQITINCQSLPITVEFDYINDAGALVTIGQFQITSLQPIQVNNHKMKVRVRLDPSGVIQITSASIQIENDAKATDNGTEAVTDVNNADSQPAEEQPMETDNPPKTDENQKNGPVSKDAKDAKPTKPKITSIELQVQPIWIRGKLSEADVQRFREIELNLILSDKNWKERIDARNELEEFVYEWRDKLDGERFEKYLTPEDKSSFLAQLDSTEKWLYDEEETTGIQSKSVYEEKVKQMKDTYSTGILFREHEDQNRSQALDILGQRQQLGRKLLESREDIDEANLKKLDAELLEKEQWFNDALNKLTSAVKTQNPPITIAQIRQQSDALDAVIRPIMSEKQRKLQERQKKQDEEQKKLQAEQQPQPPAEGENPQPEKEQPPPMDVDTEQVHPTI